MINLKLHNQTLKFEKTGKISLLNKIRPGLCFLFNNQIWEKVPDSAVNLSDLKDGSEIISNPEVEILKEIK